MNQDVIILPINAVLPPPILRPTQRPTERGLRQKLWDKGLEIEQMAQEYARGDSLEIIAVRWDVSQPSARGYILLAGGKMRPSSLPGPKRRYGRAKGIPLNISDSERQRRAAQGKINAETRAKNNRARNNSPEVVANLRTHMLKVRALRHKREDAFLGEEAANGQG